MAADYRIGDSHLNVGHGGYRGFGGFCLPKDTAAFMNFAKSVGAKEVHDLLMSDWKFNEEILAEQGLTIEDVSKHIDEVRKILDVKKNVPPHASPSAVLRGPAISSNVPPRTSPEIAFPRLAAGAREGLREKKKFVSRKR